MCLQATKKSIAYKYTYFVRLLCLFSCCRFAVLLLLPFKSETWKICFFLFVGVCGYFIFFCSALIFDYFDCASAWCGRKRQWDCVFFVSSFSSFEHYLSAKLYTRNETNDINIYGALSNGKNAVRAIARIHRWRWHEIIPLYTFYLSMTDRQTRQQI